MLLSLKLKLLLGFRFFSIALVLLVLCQLL